MRKRLIIIGIIVLIAVGAGVLVWQRNAKPIVSDSDISEPTVSPTSEELAKQMVELEKQIVAKKAEIDSSKKQREEEYANELEEIKRQDRIDGASGIGTPEGVTVLPRGNNLIIKNEREGYEITVPNTWVIADSGDSSDISFYDKESYEILGGLMADRFWIKDILNEKNIPLNEWIKKVPDYLNINGDIPIEKFNLNNIDGYKSIKITPLTANADNPDPVQGATRNSYIYYFSKNGKIYVIMFTNKYNLEILNTFEFL